MSMLLGEYKTQLLLGVAKKIKASVLGDAAEFGVYQGGVLCELAQIFHPPRTVWGYDTFKGLPAEDWEPGEPHSAGDFRDTSLEVVTTVCAPFPNIRLVDGHIPDSLLEARFCFVHLDLDFYKGTRAALDWLAPRMNAGGAIVLDDFGWEYCPGIKRAVEELGLPYFMLMEYQAVIQC